MLSPATLAVLQRLVAILLALVEALVAPVDGAPRPLGTRLAAGAFVAYLKNLAAHLTELAGQDATDPVPSPRPPPAHGRLVGETSPPRIIRLASRPRWTPPPSILKSSANPSPLQHA